MKGITFYLTVASLALFIGGCSESKPAETPVEIAVEGVPVSISSDSNAQYFILEQNKEKNNARTITTKRVGSSGTSYSKRLYNCEDSTVKYLGTGDTKESMEASAPDANMGPILEGSIAYEFSVIVCQ